MLPYLNYVFWLSGVKHKIQIKQDLKNVNLWLSFATIALKEFMKILHC